MLSCVGDRQEGGGRRGRVVGTLRYVREGQRGGEGGLWMCYDM